MRMTKSLLLGISAIALSTGAAFAGEDSTHRWHGTGAEYHETIGGLNLYSDAESVGADQFSEPDARMAMPESYDVYYIYPVEVVEYVIVPRVDTEMPQG